MKFKKNYMLTKQKTVKNTRDAVPFMIGFKDAETRINQLRRVTVYLDSRKFQEIGAFEIQHKAFEEKIKGDIQFQGRSVDWGKCIVHASTAFQLAKAYSFNSYAGVSSMSAKRCLKSRLISINKHLTEVQLMVNAPKTYVTLVKLYCEAYQYCVERETGKQNLLDLMYLGEDWRAKAVELQRAACKGTDEHYDTLSGWFGLSGVLSGLVSLGLYRSSAFIPSYIAMAWAVVSWGIGLGAVGKRYDVC